MDSLSYPILALPQLTKSQPFCCGLGELGFEARGSEQKGREKAVVWMNSVRIWYISWHSVSIVGPFFASTARGSGVAQKMRPKKG